MYTPVNPNFTIQKWDVRGSTLHGHFCMMNCLLSLIFIASLLRITDETYTERKKKLYTYLFNRFSANTYPRNIIFISN